MINKSRGLPSPVARVFVFLRDGGAAASPEMGKGSGEMPQESGNTDTQTQDKANPTTTTNGTSGGSGGAGGTTTNTPTLEQLQEELTKAQAALKEVNSESAKRRKRLDELEKAETERQQAQLSETEKLTQERDRYKAELEKAQSDAAERTKRHAVEMAAKDAKFAKPAHYVHALIAAAGLKVEIGDDGEVTGIDAAIKKLQADMPELFEKPSDPPPNKPKGTPAAQPARQTGANAAKPQPTSTLKF